MKKIPDAVRKELARLAAKSESEIDFSDIPASSQEDWKDAVRGNSIAPSKNN